MIFRTFKCLFLLAALFVSSGALADKLRPFESDGCSVFPDGTFSQKALWLSCCTVHDLAYWQGGTYEQRLNADKALEVCVAEVGEPEIAVMMLAGVRVGGSPYWPTSFRWGYGWPYPRLYGVLTAKEEKAVKSELLKLAP